MDDDDDVRAVTREDVSTDPVGRVSAIEPDWVQWLPPRGLPDTGAKEFKQGQVWATHIGEAPSKPSVWRVGAPIGSGSFELIRLAGQPSMGHVASGYWFTKHAVLLQDVGEDEPLPPLVAYAELDAVRPATCISCGGDKEGNAWMCNACWQRTRKDDSNVALLKAWNLRLQREQLVPTPPATETPVLADKSSPFYLGPT
jgi:hypothetical protein